MSDRKAQVRGRGRPAALVPLQAGQPSGNFPAPEEDIRFSSESETDAEARSGFVSQESLYSANKRVANPCTEKASLLGDFVFFSELLHFLVLLKPFWKETKYISSLLSSCWNDSRRSWR